MMDNVAPWLNLTLTPLSIIPIIISLRRPSDFLYLIIDLTKRKNPFSSFIPFEREEDNERESETKSEDDKSV